MESPSSKEKRYLKRLPWVPWWWLLTVVVLTGIVSGGLYLITK